MSQFNGGVPSTNEVASDEIIDYFSTFGRVENVHIFNHQTYLLGQIKFAISTTAVTVTKEQSYTIGDRNIRVAIADSECRVNFFSNKLSNTATALRLDLNDVHDAELIIKTFASLISELRIGGSKFDEEELANLLTLTMRCCGETLESLIIHNFVVPKPLMVELKPLLNKLQKLHIDCLIVKGGTTGVLNNCESLIELKVEFYIKASVKTIDLQNVFAKLERFAYNGQCDSKLKEFLSRQKNLKSVNFSRCPSSLVPIIADNCRNLETLKFEFSNVRAGFDKDIQSIFGLGRLRKLKFDFNEQNVTKFIQQLKALKSLQSLALLNVQADSHFTPALTQLKTLQVLRLHFCSRLQNLNELSELNQLRELSIFSYEDVTMDVIHLIKHLSSLKILKFRSSTFKMDKQLYLQIVNVISCRTQQYLEITCHIADDLLQCDKYNPNIVRIYKRK